MKPLNLNTESCTPVSSNCVIWNGPNIDCIGLCKGATVTNVVYELATKLCSVLDTLDVSKYDLDCLNITTCPPETFEELVKVLIERICEISNTPCPPCEDGAPGNYIVTDYEPAGPNCDNGGVVIYTYDGVTNLPISAETRYVCDGAEGEPGGPGVPGGPGSPGRNGLNGQDGADGDPSSITFQQSGDCNIQVTEIQGSPDYIFKIESIETDWQDLRGFDHYVNIAKPQVKRIGSQLHFKGIAILPLSSDSGATLVSMTAYNTYDDQPYSQVYKGIGGVNTNSAGSLTLNSGASVLPLDLDLCDKTLDDSYQKQYIAARQILTDEGERGIALSAVFQIILNTNGTLVIQTIRDIEQSTMGISTSYGGSALRYITSNVKMGEHVPDFISAGTRLHYNPLTGNQSAVVNYLAGGTYPFDCDAGDPEQIGGFFFRLDGLIAYLS